MGNCDSSNQYLNNRRDSIKFVPNYSSPSLPVVTSLKEKKYNLISHKSKKNLSTERNTYLLPENISKREDITKIYRLSKNIFSYGATSLLYIGEKNTKEKFAVKRILKQNIVKKQKMLVKEAEICIKLHHDNIIKYYEIYEDKNFINIVMELGDIDLFEFISKSPNSIIPDLLAIDLLIQIFQVIDFIHSNNIIHCDIKPENFVVIFNKNNKNHPILKLIDFGNARKIGIEEKDKLKSFCGTKEYMAPEIFEGKGFNEKVDEWAAGILMFNMLTGCEPFCSGSDCDFKDDLLNKEINFNKIKNERLRELNRKLLVRNAEKRISAKEALKEIQLIKKDLMTINLMNNINNNKSDYLDFITKKISLISIS